MRRARDVEGQVAWRRLGGEAQRRPKSRAKQWQTAEHPWARVSRTGGDGNQGSKPRLKQHEAKKRWDIVLQVGPTLSRGRRGVATESREGRECKRGEGETRALGRCRMMED